MKWVLDSKCLRNRLRQLLGLSVVIGNLAFLSVAPASAQSGKTLVIAQPVDIQTMDPTMHRSRETENVIRQVSNALVMSSKDLQPLPELALSWQPIDENTWEFKLREGVKFTNGEPFNAEAVKFTFDRILDPATKSPRAALLPTLKGTEVVDEYTVRFITKEPTATLPIQLATQEIVPPKYLQEVGAEQFAKAPIGTGPFIFESWTPGQQVILKANPEYWDGAPNVDRVIFRPIPEIAARVAALRSGEVAIASAISPDLAPTLTGNVTKNSVPGTAIVFLAMNVTKAPFDKLEVRQAVQKAVNATEIVDALFTGEAEVLNQLAFKAMDGYDPDFPGVAYDLDAAKAVLKDVTEPVQLTTNEAFKMVAEAVAGQLQAAGLKVSVNVIDNAALTAATNSGDVQAYVNRWGFAKGDSDTVFTTHFHSTSRKLQFFTGFSNPEVDELIEKARAASFEPGKAKPLYAELNRKVMEAAPWVPLMAPNDIYGMSVAVENWEPSPDGRFNIAKTALK